MEVLLWIIFWIDLFVNLRCPAFVIFISTEIHLDDAIDISQQS